MDPNQLPNQQPSPMKFAPQANPNFKPIQMGQMGQMGQIGQIGQIGQGIKPKYFNNYSPSLPLQTNPNAQANSQLQSRIGTQGIIPNKLNPGIINQSQAIGGINAGINKIGAGPNQPQQTLIDKLKQLEGIQIRELSVNIFLKNKNKQSITAEEKDEYLNRLTKVIQDAKQRQEIKKPLEI